MGRKEGWFFRKNERAKMPLQIGAGAILAVKRFQFLKTENKA
jgi:hypothetical protein